MAEIENSLLNQLTRELPVTFVELDISKLSAGLIIVDEDNGFATIGSGNLAPKGPNQQVSNMVRETNQLAKRFTTNDWPIMVFMDTHEPGKPELPYPPHCEIGTGEENLVPELDWLADQQNVTLLRKDCINGFVGGIQKDGSNLVINWCNYNNIELMLVVGICTDICVMDFVLTMLSGRNHNLTKTLKEVAVYAPGCSTYDLPLQTVQKLGLPISASHPQALTHHLGLYFMSSRGARIASVIKF